MCGVPFTLQPLSLPSWRCVSTVRLSAPGLSLHHLKHVHVCGCSQSQQTLLGRLGRCNRKCTNYTVVDPLLAAGFDARRLALRCWCCRGCDASAGGCAGGSGGCMNALRDWGWTCACWGGRVKGEGRGGGNICTGRYPCALLHLVLTRVLTVLCGGAGVAYTQGTNATSQCHQPARQVSVSPGAGREQPARTRPSSQATLP